MNSTQKRRFEKDQVVQFISNEELGLIVTSLDEGNDPPDFVIAVGDRKISIEHTTLVVPELQKEQVYRNSIIKEAQKRFENKYDSRLVVLLTFDNIPLMRGVSERLNYVDEVYSLVENVYLNNSDYKFRVSTRGTFRKRRPTSIKDIVITNENGYSNWQHFGSYMVKTIDLVWLGKRIKNKENILTRYENEFNENWLLMVAHFGTEASAHGFDSIDFSVIHTKFDKVFIYEYMSDKVTCVK